MPKRSPLKPHDDSNPNCQYLATQYPGYATGSTPASPDYEAALSQFSEQLKTALQALDPDTRSVLLRRFVAEDDMVLIAKDMGLTPFKAQAMVLRGLCELNKLLCFTQRDSD